MLERFEGYIDVEDLELVEMYMYKDDWDWEWVSYAVEDAEDVETVEEIVKVIYEQIKEEDEDYQESKDNDYYKGLNIGHKMLKGTDEKEDERLTAIKVGFGIK